MGHADLAPLAALTLLRAAMGRWKSRWGIKGASAPGILVPISEVATAQVPSATGDAPANDFATADVMLPSQPRVSMDSPGGAAAVPPSGSQAVETRRAAVAARKAASKAAKVAELALARLSFHNPYVLPFFRPSDDLVRFRFFICCVLGVPVGLN